MTDQRRETLIRNAPQLCSLAMANLLASLGLSIMTVALPSLAADFSAQVPKVQWAVLSYLLAVTVSAVTAGRLGDWYGHRSVLLIGLAIFLAASVAGFLAPSLVFLFGARILQGIGAAVMMVLPISLIRDTVPDEKTGIAMGLLGTTSAIGTALGPSLGGFLIDWWNWQATFGLLGGLALVNFTLVGFAFPNDGTRPSVRSKLDLPGTLFLTASLLAFALAVSGTTDPLSVEGLAFLALATGGLILFVRAEARSTNPLVDIPTLRTRAIRSSLIMNLLVSAGMMATLTVGPFYLTLALSLTPAAVGLVMSAGPAFAAVSGLIAGRLTDRFGTATCLRAALWLLIAGFLGLALLPGLLGPAGYVMALAILTPGYQLFLVANNTGTMRAAPGDGRGMVSGLLGLSRNLGLLTGASVLASLFSATVAVEDIALAPVDDIRLGFVVTFVAAAALIAVAMLVRVSGSGTADAP